jgi:hypothetical protein
LTEWMFDFLLISGWDQYTAFMYLDSEHLESSEVLSKQGWLCTWRSQSMYHCLLGHPHWVE